MSDQAFPPADPASFLALCAGEWMSLRSSFALSNGDDDWHTSERGELTVRFESGSGELLGRLLVEPGSGTSRALSFSWFLGGSEFGRFIGKKTLFTGLRKIRLSLCKTLVRMGWSKFSRFLTQGGCLEIDANKTGTWHFWPDGSVELHLPQPDGSLVQERIWFTRANLRLRSTTAVDAGGNPLEGSFCTDIRRVSKPAV